MPTKGEIDKERMFRKIIPSAKAAPVKPETEASALFTVTNLNQLGTLPLEMPEDKQEAETPVPQAQRMPPQAAPPPVAQAAPPAAPAEMPQAPTETMPVQAMPPQVAPPPVAQAAPPAASVETPQAPGMSPPVATPPVAQAAPPAAPVSETVPLTDATKVFEGPPPYPVNLAEYLVNKNYDRFRQKVEGCECERCRDDVFAITLNKIKPQYVVSNHLQEALLDTRELTTEIVTSMMNALFLVKRNPHHGE